MTNHAPQIVFRIGFGLLALLAIGTQLGIHLQLGFSAVNFFSYFTNLSNLLAAAALLFGGWQLLSRREPTPATDLLRGEAAICMTVVGIVFAILLRDVDLGSLLPWVNAMLHYVMPLAMVAEWLRWPPRAKLGAQQLPLLLLLPVLYLVYTLARGAAVGWYPYPFLNPAIVGGYAGVAAYIAGIVVVFGVAGWALLALANRRVAARQLP